MEREFSFTEADVKALEALLDEMANQADLQHGDDGYVTTRELCEAKGWRVANVRKWLRQLIEAGRVEIGRTPRMTIAGVSHMEPGYRLKGAE